MWYVVAYLNSYSVLVFVDFSLVNVNFSATYLRELTVILFDIIISYRGNLRLSISTPLTAVLVSRNTRRLHLGMSVSCM